MQEKIEFLDFISWYLKLFKSSNLVNAYVDLTVVVVHAFV